MVANFSAQLWLPVTEVLMLNKHFRVKYEDSYFEIKEAQLEYHKATF